MALISRLIGTLLTRGRITLVQPDGSRETYGPGGGKELTVQFADKRVAFDDVIDLNAASLAKAVNLH